MLRRLYNRDVISKRDRASPRIEREVETIYTHCAAAKKFYVVKMSKSLKFIEFKREKRPRCPYLVLTLFRVETVFWSNKKGTRS